MKIRIEDVRKIIREELRGVPLFVFREETRLYVEKIREQLHRHVLVDKSPSQLAQGEAMVVVDEVLKELEDEINAILEQKLYNFMQQT